MNARQEPAGIGQKKTSRGLPTAAEVRSVLDYDPGTGDFRWRKTAAKKIRVGDVAGHHKADGYLHIGFNYRTHLAHRLAWLWVKGEWPAAQLDHRDGDRANNAIDNLREATQAANMQNRRKAATRAGRPTSSKYLGVSWAKNKDRWQAHIRHNGKLQSLGLFDTEELAYAAYLKAKAVLHTAQPIPRDTAYDKHPAHTQ